MNRAINEENDTIIKASELQFIENVESMTFKCIDFNCGIRVVASSYKKHNIQAPHFRKLKGIEHVVNCDYAKNNTIYVKGIQGLRVSKGEVKQLGVPTKFNIKFEDYNIIKDEPVSNNKGKNVQRDVRGGKEVSFEDSGYTDKTVSAIDQIVTFYLGFPANRDEIIKIDNFPISYDKLFKEIVVNKKYIGVEKQFFFSKILVTKDRNPQSSYKDIRNIIYVKLFPIDYNNNKPGGRYEIIINKEELSARKINLLKKSFDLAYSEMLYNPKDGYDLYVFFVGNAPKDSDSISFSLINSYICFRYTDVRPSGNSNDD